MGERGTPGEGTIVSDLEKPSELLDRDRALGEGDSELGGGESARLVGEAMVKEGGERDVGEVTAEEVGVGYCSCSLGPSVATELGVGLVMGLGLAMGVICWESKPESPDERF